MILEFSHIDYEREPIHMIKGFPRIFFHNMANSFDHWNYYIHKGDSSSSSSVSFLVNQSSVREFTITT